MSDNSRRLANPKIKLLFTLCRGLSLEMAFIQVRNLDVIFDHNFWHFKKVNFLIVEMSNVYKGNSKSSELPFNNDRFIPSLFMYNNPLHFLSLSP